MKKNELTPREMDIIKSLQPRTNWVQMFTLFVLLVAVVGFIAKGWREVPSIEFNQHGIENSAVSGKVVGGDNES